MSIYETLKKAVAKTAKDAVKVSGELVEQTKLKLKAAEIKNQIEKDFTKIGELYFTMSEYATDKSDEIKALLEQVKELKDILEDVEGEISKNTSKCASCGALNKAEDVYCSKCGKEL